MSSFKFSLNCIGGVVDETGGADRVVVVVVVCESAVLFMRACDKTSLKKCSLVVSLSRIYLIAGDGSLIKKLLQLKFNIVCTGTLSQLVEIVVLAILSLNKITGQRTSE